MLIHIRVRMKNACARVENSHRKDGFHFKLHIEKNRYVKYDTKEVQ